MKSKVLPKLICKHPYFHEDLDEEQAKYLLNTTSEGNFLFCPAPGNIPNQYYFICKGFSGNLPMIKSISCTYIAERFETSITYGGLESVLPGLKAIAHFVEKYKNSFRHLTTFTPFIFTPCPVYNSTVKNNRLELKSETRLIPLETDTTRIIFQNLDMPALLASTRVSKSWYTFFNRNFLATVITQRENIEQIKIREAEIRPDSNNAEHLIMGGASSTIYEF